MRGIVVLLLIALGGGAYYYFIYRPAHRRPAEVAYVLPESLELVDAPATVRVIVATAQSGDRVEVLARSRTWARVRLSDARVGWAEARYLLDAQTHDRAQQLLEELESSVPQAVGHTTGEANLRLEPSRDAPQLAQLRGNQRVEVFGRRVLDRPAQPGSPASGAPLRDAWYLVRAESRAGWVLGRSVALDVPEEISMYAQGINLVAWLVLNTVDDAGRQVPQYLVADRVATQEFDFDRIRVLTWWAKRQAYATAYVESNVSGYFPIRVMPRDNIPYFRLRLVDRNGRQFQKVYGMFDTLVRPLGIVEGWGSDAMPAPPVRRPRRAR